MFRQMLTLRFCLVHYFWSEPLAVWTSSLWFQLPPNLIILNGTPAWYKYKLCTYFLISLFRFFPLIREGLSSYEWITFLHFLTLSLCHSETQRRNFLKSVTSLAEFSSSFSLSSSWLSSSRHSRVLSTSLIDILFSTIWEILCHSHQTVPSRGLFELSNFKLANFKWFLTIDTHWYML